MPLRFEFLEGVPVELVGDHLGMIAQQLLEAVKLGGVEGIRVGQPYAEQID